MWCLDDMVRDSWDWVGPPAWERACFNSQSGVEAPRLLKRNLSRLYCCCCVVVGVLCVLCVFVLCCVVLCCVVLCCVVLLCVLCCVVLLCVCCVCCVVLLLWLLWLL